MPGHPHEIPPVLRLPIALLGLLAWLSALPQAGGPAGTTARTAGHDQAPAVDGRLPLVPVNVRVIDRFGRPVAGLQAADFTVTDNDVPQPIKYFSVETLTTAPGDGAATPAPRKAIWLSPQPYRLFVIFLGRGRLDDVSKAVTALTQFVRTRLVPQDRVAVFAYDRATALTTDHEKVAQVLERFKRVHTDIDHEIDLQLGPTNMGALYGRKVIPARLQAKIDEMIGGPGARTPAGTTLDVLETKAFAELSLDDFMFSTAQTLQDQGNLVCLMEYLRRFEGEKHVLFVTEHGMPMPSEQADARVASLASDARAAIHTIQAGGIVRPEPGKELEATQLQAFAFKSLRTMARLSGGLAIFGESGANAMNRIDELSRTSYLIGYQPRATAGPYRQIAVKVNRPDVTVLCRSGYYPAAEAEPFSRRLQITADRLLAAGMFRRQINDIRLRASARQSGDQLRIDVKVDPSRLVLDAAPDGTRATTLHAAVFSLDTDAQPVGVDQQELTVKMTDEEFKRYQKDWIPYTLQFPARRGTDNIRFVVYDYAADLIGRVDTKVF